MGLLRVLRESRDPKFIPIFIDFSFMAAEAKTALQDFGEPAVPALLGAIRGTDNSMNRRHGSTSTLAMIMRRSKAGLAPPLSDDHLQEILMLARELFAGGFDTGGVGGTAQLALASGQPELRRQLEELATDRTAWIRRGVTADWEIDFFRRIVAYLLKTPVFGEGPPACC